MPLADLSLEQLKQLLARAEHDLGYYARLKERMYRCHFPGDLVNQVERVHADLQHWRMTLHYEVISRQRQQEGGRNEAQAGEVIGPHLRLSTGAFKLLPLPVPVTHGIDHIP